MIDNEFLEKYKRHPRIVELRFVLTYRILEKEYGVIGAMNLIEGLCKGFKRSFTLLNATISKRFDILKVSKTDNVFFKQQVLLMGACNGYTKRKICNKYLFVSDANFCKDEFDINKFVTDEWLERLDDSIIACGNYQYRQEVEGFLEILDQLALVLADLGGR